jgi:hypothetical protein
MGLIMDEGHEIVPTLIIAPNVIELRDSEGDVWVRQDRDQRGDDRWYLQRMPTIRDRYTDSLIDYCPLKVLRVSGP